MTIYAFTRWHVDDCWSEFSPQGYAMLVLGEHFSTAASSFGNPHLLGALSPPEHQQVGKMKQLPELELDS